MSICSRVKNYHEKRGIISTIMITNMIIMLVMIIIRKVFMIKFSVMINILIIHINKYFTS